MQKRASVLVRWAARLTLVVLICPLLAAGLDKSVGYAWSGDRRDEFSASQVAPAGCVKRSRSPHDRNRRLGGAVSQRAP